MDTSHAHPTEKFYIKVAAWLALITAVEIAVSYESLADWLAIPILLVLAVIKFAAVVAHFMHLKYDAKMLRKPFVGGLLLAIAVYTAVLLAFTLHSNTPPT